jgi:hypothetical protein
MDREPAAANSGDDRWFGKPEGGFSLQPLTWQGRFCLILWAVLCMLALVLYLSQLALMVFVIALYTVILACIVLFKSDLRAEMEARAKGDTDR